MSIFQLTNLQYAQASTYLEGAVNAVLRRRPLLGWLDNDGRVNRDAEGKDFNWLIEYKELEAQPYTPFSQMDFYDTNYHLPMAVTPVFYNVPSAMDITTIVQNTGPAQIVNLYNQRASKLARAMQITTEKSMYNDANSTTPGTGAAYMTGLGTFAHKSKTIGSGPNYVTNACRMAAPDETILYGGQSIGLGSHGGGWSNGLPSAQQMNPLLGNDYPDGTPDLTQRYDTTAPRLYNENTNQWLNLGAAAANGTWAANCIAILARANTDLRLSNVDTMMPNLHLMGSGRYQAVRDLLRQAFRYTMDPPGESKNLGYLDTISFEGGDLVLDQMAGAQFTYSVCGASCAVNFWGTGPLREAMAASEKAGDANLVTGGIFAMLGPVQDPRGLSWLWQMFAGGQIRWNTKWITIIGDFINNG